MLAIDRVRGFDGPMVDKLAANCTENIGKAGHLNKTERRKNYLFVRKTQTARRNMLVQGFGRRGKHVLSFVMLDLETKLRHLIYIWAQNPLYHDGSRANFQLQAQIAQMAGSSVNSGDLICSKML